MLRLPNDLAGIPRRFLHLVLFADTRPTQFFLGLVALVWALGLAHPSDTFSRPVYQFMAAVASENAWAALWGALSVALLWRVFDTRLRPFWSLLIHGCSLTIFMGVTGSMVATKFVPWPAAVSGDLVCVLAALWVLVRVQTEEEGGSYE